MLQPVTSRSALLVSALAATAAMTLAAAPAHAAATGAGAKPPIDDHGAYCQATGGAPSLMRAWSGTNNDASQWMAYGGIVQACTYTAEDTSQITIWESTLRSPLPTMAALAYYAKVPLTPGGHGNPAPGYCVQLGGAWQVGNGLDGGGWATGRGQRVYGMCVFADGSAIDDWGLLYHSSDIIRGIDLATVMKFANPY